MTSTDATPTKTPALLPTREELKPCPLCGADVTEETGFADNFRNGPYLYASCSNCTYQADISDHRRLRHSPAPGKGDEAHPDLAGHTADAVQDACRAHVGLIINSEIAVSEIAVKIANDILAKQASVNAEYAALASPATPAGDSEGILARMDAGLSIDHIIASGGYCAKLAKRARDAAHQALFSHAFTANRVVAGKRVFEGAVPYAVAHDALIRATLATATPPEAVDGGDPA